DRDGALVHALRDDRLQGDAPVGDEMGHFHRREQVFAVDRRGHDGSFLAARARSSASGVDRSLTNARSDHPAGGWWKCCRYWFNSCMSTPSPRVDLDLTMPPEVINFGRGTHGVGRLEDTFRL